MRILRGHRGYAALAITSLSLSVGATLVVFTVVNALWLKPSPIPEVDRVVTIVSPSSGLSDGFAQIGLEDTDRWNMFAAFAGQLITAGDRAKQAARLTFEKLGRELETLGVTSKYFAVLGQPIRGRDFTRGDSQPGAEPVAIISDALWSTAFDRRGDVIGAVVPARPIALRIIGVAPPGFEGARRGEHTEVWLPAPLALRLSPAATTDGSGSMLLLGRLRPGQTPADIKRLHLEHTLATTNVAPGPSLQRYRESLERLQVVRLTEVFGSPFSRTVVVREGRAAAVVAALAALVLLGSCATLMALVLVHYERRRRELSVRLALGASRRRLAAQLGREFGWIAVAGTAGAIGVALTGLHGLPALSLTSGVDLGRLDLSLDWRVLAAAIGATTGTVALAAFMPLARFTRADLAGEIVAVRSTTPRSSQRLRQGLLAVHVAATVVVLVSAGLFVRAVLHGFSAGPGFDVDRTVSVRLQFPGIAARSAAEIRAGLAAVHEKTNLIADAIRAQPGVDVVASGFLPIGLERMNQVMTPTTVEAGGESRQLTIGSLYGGPELSNALGVSVLSGRALTAADVVDRGARGPALVTASLARTLFPDGEPLGQIVSLVPGGAYEIVGVVSDLAYGSLSQPVAGVVLTVRGGAGISPSFVVRTPQPDAMAEPIRRVIASVAPELELIAIETGRTIIARDLGPPRLGAWFFSGFGLIALVLGAAGVFGLVAYLAESRRREFGVRVALGASPRELVRRGISAGLVPVCLGGGTGVIAAAIVTRLFVSSLPGLSPLDPITYVSVALLLTICAAGAGLAAAWRLRRIAPAEALRAE